VFSDNNKCTWLLVCTVVPRLRCLSPRAAAASIFILAGPGCSRPTAVNLSIAAEALKQLAAAEAAKEGASGTSVTAAVVTACEDMLATDVAANKVRPSCCSRRQGKLKTA
jgi:hypothetical protein